MNGGSCFGSGECVCPPGYAGAFCQEKRTISECGLFSCENSGACFIDNQNEYSCICPSGFTGKRCNIKITTTSKTTTSQSTTQTTASSTIFSTTTSENKIIIEKSDSFTSQEIALILIVGVGVQILFILVAVIFYKTVILRKKNDQVADEETGEKMENLHKQQPKPSKKENIYVICSSEKSSQESDLSKNMSEKINKVATKNKSSNDTEVYSSCIYDDLNEYTQTKSISVEFVQEKSLYSNDLITYV